MTRIAVDAMGGDYAPFEIVAGAVWAAAEYGVSLELVGKQDQIEECLEKVKLIRELNQDIDIEVDGGINEITAQKAKKAGANVLVAGTAIFGSNNKKEMIEKMKI